MREIFNAGMKFVFRCVFYSTRVLRAAFKPAERNETLRRAEGFMRAPASSAFEGRRQSKLKTTFCEPRSGYLTFFFGYSQKFFY